MHLPERSQSPFRDEIRESHISLSNLAAEPQKRMHHSISLDRLNHDMSGNIKDVERSLVDLQRERENVQNELNKIPDSYGKSRAQRDRRNYLESQFEQLSRQINEAKLFVRKKKESNRMSFVS